MVGEGPPLFCTLKGTPTDPSYARHLLPRLVKRAGLERKGAPLFCTLKWTATDPSYARHLLPRLAKRAGLERRVHPHGLRHTHAADLALAGVPVLAIQQQLGHHSLTTTANYLRRVGVRLDLARAIRSRTGN